VDYVRNTTCKSQNQSMLRFLAVACFLMVADGFQLHSSVALRCMSSEPPKQIDVTSSSRRNILKVAGGALFALPVAANAEYGELSSISKVQGPIQDIIQPGHWIGQFIGVNSHSETWQFSQSPEKVSAALVATLEQLSPGERKRLLIPNFEIRQKDATRVHVLTWTKSEWLDALDVGLEATPAGGTKAKVSFYATGFFPTSIPLAPLLNTALFFFPFASPGGKGGLLQNFRIDELEAMVSKRLKA